MSWVRLWRDMPTDPKWRVIAKVSGQSIPNVMAVFVVMITNAGGNTTERGKLLNWSDESTAAALDLETAAVSAIREAMQGRVLDGDRLTGWEKRQPKKEDQSAERAKKWRERNRTKTNATERPRTKKTANKRPESYSNSSSDSDAKSKNDLLIIQSEQAAAQSPKSRFGSGNPNKHFTTMEVASRYAEALGLPVGELQETTRRYGKNLDAYFITLCVNQLRSVLPKMNEYHLRQALSGTQPAYGHVVTELSKVAQTE